MAQNNDVKWLKHLDLLVEYLKNPNTPQFTCGTMYKGDRIGQWYHNQQIKFNNGRLLEHRAIILNEKLGMQWYEILSLRRNFFPQAIIQSYKDLFEDYRLDYPLNVDEFFMLHNLRNDEAVFNYMCSSNFKYIGFYQLRNEVVKRAFYRLFNMDIYVFFLATRMLGINREQNDWNFPARSSSKSSPADNVRKAISNMASAEDIDNFIKNIMPKILTEREYECLMTRYDIEHKEIRTLEEVKKSLKYDVSRQRCAQLIEHAFNKLYATNAIRLLEPNPPKCDIVNCGLSRKAIYSCMRYSIFSKATLCSAPDTTLKNIGLYSYSSFLEILDLREKLLFEKNNIEVLKIQKKNIEKAKEIEEVESVAKVSFAPLHLSNRCKNVLRRNNIFTMKEIVENISKIKDLHYVGKQTLQELEKELNKNGIITRKEDFYV